MEGGALADAGDHIVNIGSPLANTDDPTPDIEGLLFERHERLWSSYESLRKGPLTDAEAPYPTQEVLWPI